MPTGLANHTNNHVQSDSYDIEPQIFSGTICDLIVDGQVETCQIATASPVSFLSARFVRRRGIQLIPVDRDPEFTISGAPLTLCGKALINLKIGNKTVRVLFHVVEKQRCDVLIGCNVDFGVDFGTREFLLAGEKVPFRVADNPPNLILTCVVKSRYPIND